MPVVRRLQCCACSVIYRSIYRGRRPLCNRCRSAHASVDHTLQESLAAGITSCQTSFVQLPVDALHSLVPHLLMCRMPAEPYDWAVSNHMHDLLLRHEGTKLRDIGYVARYAWLPILRIKLVSKSLHGAVDVYLSSILRPEPRCSQAAAVIQRIVKARLSWLEEMQRTWAWTVRRYAPPDHPYGPPDHLGIPSAVLTRYRRILGYEDETSPCIGHMVFGGIDYSILCTPEPVEIEWDWDDP
jgi:hypothetical protein